MYNEIGYIYKNKADIRVLKRKINEQQIFLSRQTEQFGVGINNGSSYAPLSALNIGEAYVTNKE